MKGIKGLVLLSAMIISIGRAGAQPTEPVDYVSTLVGSMSKHSMSTGNTYPAIARPWGMNFWTPQTGKMGNGWVYTYMDDKIRGFKQTHQPSPWINDYGQFALMPVTGKPVFDQDRRASWFSHKTEVAKPYYYSVYLADHDVSVELTPTERAAMFRITYPEAKDAYLVVDAFDKGSFVKVISEENKIVGYTVKNNGGVPENFRNWFVIVSDTPFEYICSVADGKCLENTSEIKADHAGTIVGFRTSGGRKVQLKVASSFISLEQAELNLGELGERTFEQVMAEGRSCWNDILGRIRVEDDNIDNLRTFYSCLYRSVLFPRNFSEINVSGEIVHYSPYNGEVRPGYLFTDTGFWDTFRCLFPLLNLVYPDMNVKMQEGLVNAYLESGFLPEWASPGHRKSMIGNNSASVVTDAYIKGLRGYDIEKLWSAVTHGANAVHPELPATGRLGWEYYNALGYVPCNVGIKESAARTLEYAYDDWCIYTLGKALGKPENELVQYKKNAMNYRNLFCAKNGLMRGRNEDGSFADPFNPLKWGGDFTEGNSLHYTWSIFHDPAGLVSLMGGREQFCRNLDNVFNISPAFDDSYYGFTIHEIREMQVMNMGNYAHGNQPIQHMLYLYNWGGQSWKAQYHIRAVMDRLYSAAPDGYCGDEDNGQTSAWYVFSALGFYPVCPGTNQYAFGSPLFKNVEITLPSGKKVVTSAKNNSDTNVYVKSLKVNGEKYTKTYITHEDLISGADIGFVMSSESDTVRRIADSDLPYSFSEWE